MKRRLWISLIGTIVAAVGALAFNLATDNKPILGLDLQGGLSVILAPEEGASEADLLVIRDLLRSSLERSGVAEPDVRVQGSNIVVDLPGVKDKEEALRSVSVSGIVELRPVVNLSDCSAPIVDREITDDVEPNGFRRTAPEPEPEDTVPPVPELFTNGAEFLPTLDGGAVCVGPAQASGEVF